MLALIALAFAFLPASGSGAAPCDLLSRADAAKVLGAPVTSADPSGPELDDESGAMRTACVYQAAGGRMLVVLRLMYKDAKTALDSTAAEAMSERIAEEKVKIEEDRGIGDRAYWMTSEIMAQYVVLKGATVTGIMLGGTPKPPTEYRAELRAAAVAVTAK
jgi:hypothetical protein